MFVYGARARSRPVERRRQLLGRRDLHRSAGRPATGCTRRCAGVGAATRPRRSPGARRRATAARSRRTRSRRSSVAPRSTRRRRSPARRRDHGRTVTGLTNGTSYTFSGVGDQQRGTRPELGGIQPAPAIGHRRRVRARCSASTPSPATTDSGDTARRRARHEVHGRHHRLRHRRALLQGRGEHRHAHRQPVVVRPGTLLASGDLHRRDRVGLAAGDLLRAGGGHRGHHLRGLVLRPRPATTRPRRRLRPSAVDNAPLHALANGSSAERRLRLRREHAFPNNTFNAANYWVDLLVRRDRPGTAPAAPTGVTATAGTPRRRQLDRAGERRQPVTSYRSRRSSVAWRRRRRPSRDAAGHDARRSRASPTGTTYTFTVHRDQRGRDRPGVGAVERGHADAGTACRARRTGVTACAGQRVGDGELDCAGERRRQPDHVVHGHAVHRRDRADAHDRSRARRRRPRRR